MKTHKQTSLITVVALAFILSACASPLDSDAPRKETPLTPAVKITPSSYDVEFTGASAQYVVKGLPTFKFDTTVTPTRCWVDYTMQAAPGTTPVPMLQEFRVRLDSFSCDGLIANLINGEVQFSIDLGTGVELFPSEDKTNTASIIVAEHPREPGMPRRVTITMYFVINKDNFFVGKGKEYPFGTIELVL